MIHFVLNPAIGQRFDVRLIERVEEDDGDRDEQKEQHEHRPDAERHAGPEAVHRLDPILLHNASKAPRRLAINRYTAMIATGTSDSAAANGTLLAMPMLP